MKFNIYVPSYKRADAIYTANLVEYCTYVVRKSEEEAYRKAGIKSILAVDDKLIDSCEKVHNWIIDNTEEDVVAVLDDDIHSVSYRLETMDRIDDKEQLTAELERLGQLLVDLDIGYLANPSDSSLMYYDKPFKFVGVTGPIKIYNKRALKSRLNLGLKFLSDMELELQELLKNRVILIPNFLCTTVGLDTNKGGNNENKSQAEFDAEDEILKNKWGKYYAKATAKSQGGIKVKR